ncbi:MAG: hypothetical protein NWE91_05780 [Candidatus Bathyarchaeota archaeon]|nr:hypothetical protein [Candidatus Bathyarchaeota archaeon]
MKIHFPFKAKIVYLILSKKPEEALEQLSRYYNVEIPKVRIGMPKGHAKNRGCYVVRKKTIYFSNQDALYNPHVVLHEFYHHLRTRGEKHRGTEKLADAFAKNFLEVYRQMPGIHGDQIETDTNSIQQI